MSCITGLGIEGTEFNYCEWMPLKLGNGWYIYVHIGTCIFFEKCDDITQESERTR